jgi:Protein N-terminal asparagine amidohydrolase
MNSAHGDMKSNQSFRHTLLYLPSDKGDTEIIHVDDGQQVESISTTFNCTEIYEASALSRLFLPVGQRSDDTNSPNESIDDKSDYDVDVYIAEGRFPVLSQANEALRTQSPLILLPNPEEEASAHNEFEICKTNCNSSISNEQPSLSSRVLYVVQGELAHCTPVQADILVSDRATTCHILGLRSSFTVSDATVNETLCTLTHLDSSTYSTCIRDAFQTHYDYHCSRYKSTVKPNMVESYIELDIHIVGGFKDNDRTSCQLTSWIMNLMADMADYYHLQKPCMKMTVRTACITAANHDNKTGGPAVRGMALDCRTGNVFAAHCIYPCPSYTLRMAKIWINGHTPHSCDPEAVSKLNVVHTHLENVIQIESLFPNGRRYCSCGFVQFNLRQQFEQLLHLRNDNLLLKFCSTSPDHEEDDFCISNRTTFRYILQQYSITNVKTTSRVSSSATTVRFCRRNPTSNAWMQTN